jgi:hypothetical protein
VVHSALSHCSSIISGDSRAAVMTSVAYRVRREVTPHISSNFLQVPDTTQRIRRSSGTARVRCAKGEHWNSMSFR